MRLERTRFVSAEMAPPRHPSSVCHAASSVNCENPHRPFTDVLVRFSGNFTLLSFLNGVSELWGFITLKSGGPFPRNGGKDCAMESLGNGSWAGSGRVRLWHRAPFHMSIEPKHGVAPRPPRGRRQPTRRNLSPMRALSKSFLDALLRKGEMATARGLRRQYEQPLRHQRQRAAFQHRAILAPTERQGKLYVVEKIRQLDETTCS